MWELCAFGVRVDAPPPPQPKRCLFCEAHQTVEPNPLPPPPPNTHRTLASGGYTVPSTVGEELAYNPFMRVTQASVVAAARAQGGAAGADPAAVMSALREMKNGF